MKEEPEEKRKNYLEGCRNCFRSRWLSCNRAFRRIILLFRALLLLLLLLLSLCLL